jgi:hypothetical protein
MHSYYISNTKDEIKSAYQELDETEFEQVVIQSRIPFNTLTDEADDDSDDDIDDDDGSVEDDNDNSDESEEQQAAFQINQNCLTFEELIDVDDEELQHALGIEVSVVIPSYEIIEHGDPEFDVESIVDNLISRRSKRSNQNVNDNNE